MIQYSVPDTNTLNRKPRGAIVEQACIVATLVASVVYIMQLLIMYLHKRHQKPEEYSI